MGLQDVMAFVPLGSAVIIGVVAQRMGRNGWKWGVLGGLALTMVLVVVSTLHVSIKQSSILAALIGVAVLICRRRIFGMIRDRTTVLLVIVTATIAVIGGYAMPMALDFVTIFDTVQNIKRDIAVTTANLDRQAQSVIPGDKPTADEVFDPVFLRKYGLSHKDIFSVSGGDHPDGLNWSAWNDASKAAAVVYWCYKCSLSAFDVIGIMSQVSEYYLTGDKRVPLVSVISGVRLLK